MKKLRKLSALFLALVMALSMSMTAFAATLTVDSSKVVTNTETVTISGIPADASVSFSTFQVVYATYDSDSNSLEFHLTDWAEAVLVNADENTRTAYQYATEEEAIAALSGITTTGKSTTEQSDLVNALASYAAATDNSVPSYNATWTVADVQAGAETTSATATLPVGSYIVLPASSTMAFLNMLVSVDVSDTTESGSTAKNGWVLTAKGAVLKGTELTIGKVVSDDGNTYGDTAEVQVGSTVSYTVTATVPKFAANSTNIKFKVVDTPENLAIDVSSVKVYGVDANGGKTELGSSAYTAGLDSAGVVLTVDFSANYLTTFYNATNGAYPYESVEITYDAEILSSAVVSTGNENEVELIFGNNTNPESTADTDTTTVYTYELDLSKLGKDDTPLSNASFKIYTNAEKTSPLTFIKNSDGTYAVADSTDIADDTVTKYDAITTGNDGTLVLTGLDGSATYYIEESVAPSGYTLNTNYLAFTITGATDAEGNFTGQIKSVSSTEYDSNDAQVSTGSWTCTVKTEDDVNTASIELTLTDTQIIELPSTGGSGTILFTIVGCVVMIAAAGLYMSYRRRVQR